MILLKILAWIVMLYGVVAFILRFIKVEREVADATRPGRTITTNEPVKLPFALPSVIVGLFLIVFLSLIVKIGPQDVGVVVTPTGVSEEELHTGWHLVAPWCDVHKMDKTVWVYTCANATNEGAKPNADAIWSPTKDGIKMGLDVSISWRIMPNEASWIYQNVTENDGGNTGRYIWLEENIIRTKLKSAIALTLREYTPIEVYSTKRQEIQDGVIKKIVDEVKKYKLIIDNVDIREIYYNAEFEKAIDAKKLAEQEVLRLVEITKQQQEKLKQAEINKNIAIEQAMGEAKALEIKGTSVAANPKIIQLEWIQKWDGKLPVTMLGDGQSVMMNLNK
jgi:regulator of protease activity HflC (stomatin/prohibitin superfamily)